MKTSLSEHELSRGIRLLERGPGVSRREFLRTLGGSAAGMALGAGLVSCGGGVAPLPTAAKPK
jgi:hypothetical protein